MASPHVAGVAAQLLELQPKATPAEVTAAIVSAASTNKVAGAGAGSPNRLLNGLLAVGRDEVEKIQPTPPANFSTVAVRRMTGRGIFGRTNWQAEVIASVRDVNTGAAVGGAIVSVHFGKGVSTSCTTSLPKGECTMLSARFPYSVTVVPAYMAGVQGKDMTYDRSQNAVNAILVYSRLWFKAGVTRPLTRGIK